MPINSHGRTGPTPGQARGPYWRRTSPGRFVPTLAGGDPVEQRILEQAQRLPPGGAVTGWASLRVQGGGFFDGLDTDERTPLPVPLAVPIDFSLRPTAGFTARRQQLCAGEVVQIHAIPCTTASRALLDEVQRLGELRSAVTAVDMTLVSGLVTLAQVDDFLKTKSDCPGRAC